MWEFTTRTITSKHTHTTVYNGYFGEREMGSRGRVLIDFYISTFHIALKSQKWGITTCICGIERVHRYSLLKCRTNPTELLLTISAISKYVQSHVIYGYYSGPLNSKVTGIFSRCKWREFMNYSSIPTQQLP